MSFNAPLFLFVFLPAVLLACIATGRKLRVWLLLVASVLFYAWGAPQNFPLILALVGVNYLLGRAAARQPEKRWPVILGIVIDISLLAGFKLLARYWPVLAALAVRQAGFELPVSLNLYLQKIIVFPIGLSFLTFQAVAYLLDIRKKPENAAASLWEFALYLLLFPKLLAGPIVRYREIAGQLRNPEIHLAGLANGARRFVTGLAKKVLIADQLAHLVDSGVFSGDLPNLTGGMAWLVILAYTLQIYHDFSGYTDMAIGLGQMFGFRFGENFNYPYISRSIAEFWRRWHITLSGWFREYVFYPLERRRRGAGGLRQAANILIVFLLTGLWHGVTPNFVIWGGLHGLAIAFETTPAGRKLASLWRPLQHVYALLVIVVGWVFFRSPSTAFALGFLRTLVGFPTGDGHLPYSILPPLEAPFWLALSLGILLALPVKETAMRLKERPAGRWAVFGTGVDLLGDFLLVGLLLFSLVVLAGASYQPYIYGGF